MRCSSVSKIYLAPFALSLIACMGDPKPGPVAKNGKPEVKPAKADAKKADTKADAKADTKKADTKADAKADADAKKADTKASPSGDAKAEAKGADAAPDAGAAAAATVRTFEKGQIAPPNLTPDEVKAYNAAQGDPRKGDFALADALAGDATLTDQGKGKLKAIFDTTMGSFECDLFEDKAPSTVANFVGLARGVRPSYDKKSDAWSDRKFYDGVLFHRVIDGFMIQTGDPTATGSGGPGYVIADEFDKSLHHKAAGMLSMANRGPNTGSSQFFVTVAPTPHLDGKHAIFGQCDTKVPLEISKVKVDPRNNNRPYEPVSIKTIQIVRKA